MSEKKQQKLELTWIGKEKRPRLEPRVLVEDSEKSHHAATRRRDGKDIFGNWLIHGDNLLALKALEQQFAGRVKCIYIDPPYNTGTAFTHYDDGLEHSIWLGLMRERLELLYKLLANDGSLWISIDDREEAYLKVTCDEIFGRENFVANIAWQRTYSKRNDSKGIPSEVEHILVYSKTEGWMPYRLPRTKDMNEGYTSVDGDPKEWSSVTINAPGAKTHAGMVYAIQHPITGILIYPPVGRCWSFGQQQLFEYMSEWAEYELKPLDDYKKRVDICGEGANVPETINALLLKNPTEAKTAAAERFRLGLEKKKPWPILYFTGKGTGGIRRKQYLDSSAGRVATNLWMFEEVGHTEEAKREIFALFGAKDAFDTPKPERLIKRVLEVATKEGDLVLDSFLGSGTTAAVAHKMGRRWIGIELLDHCYTNCAPRMNKVIDGEDAGGITKSVGWTGGGGYRFFELAPTLIKEDAYGQKIINPEYDAEKLAEAVCKLEGFTYSPSESEYFIHGHSTERDYIYVTTNYLKAEHLRALSDLVGPERSLLICCKGFSAGVKLPNLTVKKIPKAVLDKCEYGHDDYSLNVKNLPMAAPELKQDEMSFD